MKKNRLLLLLLSVFTTATYAQWAIQASGTSASLTSVDFASADTGYVVSADFQTGGLIYHSNGIPWVQQYAGADYLFTVHARQGGLAWVGGGVIGGGTILHSSNGGASWIQQTSNVEQISSIYFINDTLGWAIGNDATAGYYYIYKTTDAGSNWTQQQTGFDYLRSIFFVSPTIGWAAGDNGRIFKTTDGGTTWNLLPTGVVFHFNSVFFISSNIGWACGSYVDGGIYKTDDGGQTWSAQTIPTIEPITDLHFNSPNSGWAVGSNGVILKTGNGGISWQNEISPTTENLTDICFPTSAIGYAAGANGTIIKYDGVSSLSDQKPESISLYPNPASHFIYITSVQNVQYIEISSVSGEKVFIKPEPSSNKFDISTLEEGMFFITIHSEEGVFTSKFIKN